jgi:hypothetical protein
MSIISGLPLVKKNQKKSVITKKIFKEEFSHYNIPQELKNNLLGLFQEDFTDNDPIAQCKIFEEILEGIFLLK